MLHSLPALLDELEQQLVRGADPIPLLGSFRWQDLIDWPKTLEDAQVMKRRLHALQTLIQGLQAPVQAALKSLAPDLSYKPMGVVPMAVPVSVRISTHV